MRKIKKQLALLAAGLALAVMTTGCSSGAAQPKQIGTRNMASTASLISSMAGEEEVNAADTQLGAGTAAAATYLIKERCSPSLTNQEDTGELSNRMREESNTQKYNRYSAPTSPGLTRMARLFLYPGDWPEDEVARAALITIQEMEAELSQRSRQVVIDSYYTYTYDYSISVQQVYGDQNTAWVVGIGINQTTKEEHKT
ncbi:MAG TPA: hypothetical protein H9890_10715 [Candidatus Faecalibacterium intestinigallinarum]|uniref:Uncharacterized protein n=1 Tax=Candidatus Faecalibacterium intestinigallinarum TaxID=2838581 RepID=A0A9D1QC82_9FIRM|nr:hypothetical protein [Candidatus Faecalibacterium intestinigallinarum]